MIRFLWQSIEKVSQRHVLPSSINLCISEFDHFPFFFIWPWPVWLCCFRCECCFDSKQHRLHPRPPCLILIPKTFIDLCFVFKQLASLRKLKLLNKLKLVASHHKPLQVGDKTRYKHAQAKNLRWLVCSFDQGFRATALIFLYFLQ